jgi:hypothetical protein
MSQNHNRRSFRLRRFVEAAQKHKIAIQLHMQPSNFSVMPLYLQLTQLYTHGHPY